MGFLSSDYWTERYDSGKTGWDLKNVSPSLKAYIDQLEDKSIKIVVPGAGFGYEVMYLFQKGFKQVYYLDFSAAPAEHFKKSIPEFPEEQVLIEDFFKHTGTYDLILEQTLFCAIDPNLRDEYVKKVHELLVPDGKLVGVLFNRDFESGPPFGGTKEEYVKRFEPYFSGIKIEDCYNSVDARSGSELFVRFVK